MPIVTYSTSSRYHDSPEITLERILAATVAGGGGTGGGTNDSGHGAPGPAPSDPTKVWFYLDEDTNDFYAWNPADAAWEPLIT